MTLICYLKGGDSLGDFLDGFPSVNRSQVEAFRQIALETLLTDPDARAA